MKPALYATLPVGTRVRVESYFGNPYGGWCFVVGTILEDLGDEIKIKADPGQRGFEEFKIWKDRIREIIS
jgi:hypothetical protein